MYVTESTQMNVTSSICTTYECPIVGDCNGDVPLHGWRHVTRKRKRVSVEVKMHIAREF
jgi:hypothetical protein